MRRTAALLVIAASLFSGASYLALAQTNSSISVLGRSTLGQSRIQMVLPSSGSMGNNGALTLTTALDQTYPAAYFYMPAGAIVTASAAGWYYGVMSSTTAVTLYNNVYSNGVPTIASGTPTIPASPTAFVTTGPGAYTQTTATNITAWAIAVPGNMLGLNDEVQAHGYISYPNSAGTKTLGITYGGFFFGGVAQTTTLSQAFQGGFANTGVTNRQSQTGTLSMTVATTSAAPTVGSEDTTATQILRVYLKLSAATDYLILQNIVAEQIRAGN